MLGILRTTVLGIVSTVLLCTGALACTPPPKFDINDIEHADVVVTGSIKNYHVVKDLEARERRDRMLQPLLEKNPNSSALRQMIGPDSEHAYDYARLDIEVDEVLLGPVEPGLVTARWHNSYLGLPKKYPSGPFLIALHAMPPLKGQMSEVLRPELNFWRVLQSPCSQPFIFSSKGSTSEEVRRILNRRQWPSFRTIALLVLASLAVFALLRRNRAKAI